MVNKKWIHTVKLVIGSLNVSGVKRTYIIDFPKFGHMWPDFQNGSAIHIQFTNVDDLTSDQEKTVYFKYLSEVNTTIAQ